MSDVFSSSKSIATSQWMTPDEAEARFVRKDGDFWIGRNAFKGENPIGFSDDRHVMLVSGNRGGKGVSVLVPNLCLWRGSVVVVDPKGENATVTAARRGRGSEHCEGLGQKVYVLDPMNVAQVDEAYRARFNPMSELDPTSQHFIDDAKLIAGAIVEVRAGEDRQWDEGAVSLIHTLILYVMTDERFKDRRNLLTVRRLVQRGDWEAHAADKKRRSESAKPIKSPQVSAHVLLWELARNSDALGGVIAASADGFLQSAQMGPKQYESYRKIADANMDFLDSPGMAHCVEESDFDIAELKTDPKGVSVYLSLPQRYMATHYRWLRMMLSLTINAMEATPGHPTSGQRVLLAMDEFAGLRRMEIIENTVAQIAGYGVKLFFILQSLEQLKGVYPEKWETFLANCGVRIFFSTTDNFTNQYVSDSLGEQEIVRTVRNRSQSTSEATSRTESESEGTSEQSSTSDTTGSSRGNTRGGSSGSNAGGSESTSSGGNTGSSSGGNRGRSSGGNRGISNSRGSSENESESFGPGFFYQLFTGSQKGKGTSESSGTSEGENWGQSEGENWSNTNGKNWGQSLAKNWGKSTGRNWSRNKTKSRSRTITKGVGTNRSTSTSSGSTSSTGLSEGEGEQIFKKPLLTKDEMAKMFTRIDDPAHRAYPGIALVTIAGEAPIILRRTPYFGDPAFRRLYDPHPDHPAIELEAEPAALTEEVPAWPRDHGFRFERDASKEDPKNRERMDLSWKHRDRVMARYFSKKFTCTIEAPITVVHDMLLDLKMHPHWLDQANPHMGVKPDAAPRVLTNGSLVPSGFLRGFRDRIQERGLLELDTFGLSQNFNVPIFFDFEFRRRGDRFTEMKLEKYWFQSLLGIAFLEFIGLKKQGLYPKNHKHFMDRHSDGDLIPADAKERGWDMTKFEAMKDVREICLNFKHICEDIVQDGVPGIFVSNPNDWIVSRYGGDVVLFEDEELGLPLEPGDAYDTTDLLDNRLIIGRCGSSDIVLRGAGRIIDVPVQTGDTIGGGERLIKYRPD